MHSPIVLLFKNGETYEAACRRNERDLTSYVPIAPAEGGPHTAIRLNTPSKKSYAGFIDLITPVTIGPRNAEGLRYPISRISREDLLRLDQLTREQTRFRRSDTALVSFPRAPSTPSSLNFSVSNLGNSFPHEGSSMSSSFRVSNLQNRPADLSAVIDVTQRLLNLSRGKNLNQSHLEENLQKILSHCGVVQGQHVSAASSKGRMESIDPPRSSGEFDRSTDRSPLTKEAKPTGKSAGKRLVSQRSYGECNPAKHFRRDDYGKDGDYGGSGHSTSQDFQGRHSGHKTQGERRSGHGTGHGQYEGQTNRAMFDGTNTENMDADGSDDEDDYPPPGCGVSEFLKTSSIVPTQSDSGTGEDWTSEHWNDLEPDHVLPSKWESRHSRFREETTSPESFTSRWLRDTKLQEVDYTPEERKHHWRVESLLHWAVSKWIGRLVDKSWMDKQFPSNTNSDIAMTSPLAGQEESNMGKTTRELVRFDATIAKARSFDISKQLIFQDRKVKSEPEAPVLPQFPLEINICPQCGKQGSWDRSTTVLTHKAEKEAHPTWRQSAFGPTSQSPEVFVIRDRVLQRKGKKSALSDRRVPGSRFQPNSKQRTPVETLFKQQAGQFNSSPLARKNLQAFFSTAVTYMVEIKNHKASTGSASQSNSHLGDPNTEEKDYLRWCPNKPFFPEQRNDQEEDYVFVDNQRVQCPAQALYRMEPFFRQHIENWAPGEGRWLISVSDGTSEGLGNPDEDWVIVHKDPKWLPLLGAPGDPEDGLHLSVLTNEPSDHVLTLSFAGTGTSSVDIHIGLDDVAIEEAEASQTNTARLANLFSQAISKPLRTVKNMIPGPSNELSSDEDPGVPPLPSDKNGTWGS